MGSLEDSATSVRWKFESDSLKISGNPNLGILAIRQDGFFELEMLQHHGTKLACCTKCSWIWARNGLLFLQQNTCFQGRFFWIFGICFELSRFLTHELCFNSSFNPSFSLHVQWVRASDYSSLPETRPPAPTDGHHVSCRLKRFKKAILGYTTVLHTTNATLTHQISLYACFLRCCLGYPWVLPVSHASFPADHTQQRTSAMADHHEPAIQQRGKFDRTRRVPELL